MTLSLSVQLLNKMFKLQSTRNRDTSPRRSNSSNDSNSLNFESKNTASKVDVHKVTGQVWLKTVKVIRKAGKKSRLDVSMELIKDTREEIRDTRWRFDFVNSLDQFIYFTQVNHISITQSQFQLRSRQALLTPHIRQKRCSLQAKKERKVKTIDYIKAQCSILKQERSILKHSAAYESIVQHIKSAPQHIKAQCSILEQQRSKLNQQRSKLNQRRNILKHSAAY